MRKDNLTVDQGTTWSVSWLLRNPETKEPIADFAGWSAKAQVRRAIADVAPLFTWSTTPVEDEGTLEYEDGRIHMRVSPTESSAWSWRDGFFSVELTNPDGAVILLSTGKMKVIPEITR